MRYFQYKVMQQRLRNLKKQRDAHVQSCCLANINQFRFCHSRCSRRRLWLSSLMSDWQCLRSYMMISVERVWMVVPFEGNIFCQRWVRDWDQQHYQNGDLASTLIMGTFEKRVPVLRASRWPLCGPSEWRHLMDQPDEVTWILLTHAVKGAKKRMFPTI